MADLKEGSKVWVKQSNCGYQGPAVLLGLIHGSSWLVKALHGDERVFLAKAEFLDPLEKDQAEDMPTLSKEERKELKRKYKTERKGHTPRGDKGNRR